jgi:hypothetical protein
MVNLSANWKAGALFAIFALGLTGTGSAAEPLQRHEDLAQRVADADTREEHQHLAELYEQEAKTASEQVAYHQRMQQLYEARRDRPRRGVLQMAPYADYEARADAAAAAMVDLCKSRVRAAEQAVEDYLAFAKLHRQLAAEAME